MDTISVAGVYRWRRDSPLGEGSLMFDLGFWAVVAGFAACLIGILARIVEELQHDGD
jgi:hypothetical protein